MKPEDILNMAVEAGLIPPPLDWPEKYGKALERFAALVAAAKLDSLRSEMWEKAMKLVSEAVKVEREACAKACESQIERWVDDRARYAASECAVAIRSRI